MTLHQKGINNYNQTIKLYDQYKAQQINDEEYDKFIKDLIINRLYCSLAQILWSFCYDDESCDEKLHHWDRILPRVQASQNLYKDQLIGRIHTLRQARNDSDYYANKSIPNLVLLRSEAENIFKHFNIFGVSKC